ncbi:MAG: TolC family protein [Candidatus Omnitrophota bacterium]|nr:TolC family protein [Candidatus Omnitrophota bacterium]
MKRHTFGILIVFLLFSSLSLSEEPAKLSLDSAISEALISNPEILAAKRAYDAANARIWQAASLNDPLIEFEYDRMTADRMLSGDPMRTYAISQEVPFPTKLYLRAKIAAKLAKVSYENYRTKERAVLSEVKAAYAELSVIYKSIEVEKENKGILEQFSAVAATRYSTAQGTQADALKAQIELAKVDNELIMLEQRRLTAQARLNVLMNKGPETEIGMPAPEGTVSFIQPLENFYDITREKNPELRAYRYAIEKGKAAYDLSANELMPDFMIKFRQMMDEDHQWAGMLGATIPLWFMEKQAFGIKEMKAELEMLKAEYRMKENMVLFDVRDSFARVDANKKIIELYETAFLPQASETVNAAMRGYESGKADFLTLLDSQRMLIEFKLDHYRAILDFRVALADLERSIGAELDTLGERSKYEKQ